MQYASLEDYFFNPNRALENVDERNIEYETIDSMDKLIEKLNESNCFSSTLLDEISKILENSDFESYDALNSVLVNFLITEGSKLSKSDYEILTTYIESSKAASAFYFDNNDELDSSRSLSGLWKKYKKQIINFTISVGAGAVLGAGIGFITTGNVAVAASSAITVATFCGKKSAKTGKIVIGIEIKS